MDEMDEQDRLPFLSRWSRRKLEAKEAKPPPAAPVAPLAADSPVSEGTAAETPTAAAPGAAPAQLPSVDSLQGVASEYKDFLKPGVDETLKRAALKKLFSDPHFSFASMDKLDIYIDDYSVEDPIPEALLRSLNQSKSLFLFEEKKPQDGGVTPVASSAVESMPPATLAPVGEPEAGLGTEPSSLDFAQKQPDLSKPA